MFKPFKWSDKAITGDGARHRFNEILAVAKTNQLVADWQAKHFLQDHGGPWDAVIPTVYYVIVLVTGLCRHFLHLCHRDERMGSNDPGRSDANS